MKSATPAKKEAGPFNKAPAKKYHHDEFAIRPRPHISLKAHRGLYESSPPLDPTLNEFFVGPFTVKIHRLRDYKVFTCDVLGVEITRQLSYPSLTQLAFDLNKAVRAEKLHEADVEKLWERVIVAQNCPLPEKP